MANAKEIEQVLSQIFDEAQKKGMLVGANKQETLKAVMEAIVDPKNKTNSLEKIDVNTLKTDPTLKKVMMFALVGAFINKNTHEMNATLKLREPKPELDLSLLFKNKFDEKEKKQLKSLLNTINENIDDRELRLKPEEIEEMFKCITEKMPKMKLEHDKKHEKTPDHDMESHADKANAASLGTKGLGAAQIIVTQAPQNFAGISDVNATLNLDALSDSIKPSERQEEEKMHKASEPHEEEKIEPLFTADLLNALDTVADPKPESQAPAVQETPEPEPSSPSALKNPFSTTLKRE